MKKKLLSLAVILSALLISSQAMAQSTAVILEFYDFFNF